MKKKLLITLLVILIVLILVAGAAIGYIWYRDNHVFVEDSAYPIDSTQLDLREEEISFAHYDELHRLLPDCDVIWNVPFQGGLLSSDTDSIRVSQLTEEDVDLLVNYFPGLIRVDASACDQYNLLEALKAALPELEVTYTVSLGQTDYAPDTTELVLNNEDYDYETLMANLVHLPQVESILLKTPQLTMEQIDGLKEAYPEIAVTCTVEILGKEYDYETTELDLSALASQDVAAVTEKLLMLPKLSAVELNDAEGNSILTMEEVKSMMDALPEVSFHYSFDFYGERLSTSDEEVILKQKRIGDEGEAQVRLALDLLPNCKRFVLDYCHMSNDVLAQLREDYRGRTKIVWRIYFGEGTSLTDAEVLRSTYNVTDDNCHDLVYLEDVRYMDIGHNEFLDAIPFVAGMKSLEVVIVSGAPIKDLTPFENCPNLKILEISNCMYVTDLSPLVACENLEMVNLAYTGVSDLSPLDERSLTYLMAVRSKVPVKEQQRFLELHPDCVTTFAGTSQPYGQGWRYDSNNEPLPWYADITNAFRYPHSPNNVGWYL